jgi:hypothetical protein
LLDKAAAVVASKKLEAFGLTGRWISTEGALKLAVQEGALPAAEGGLPASSSINHRISALQLLEVRRSHEVLHSPAPHALHVADCSGSACFKTLEFADDSLVEAAPAMDSAAEKNHPSNGRRRLYLFAVVDSHSGCLWAEYQACVGPNSWAAADFLLRVWRRSCVPVHLLTDHGSEFRGAVENLSQALGIVRLNSRPRRPQARGVIERCFRTIFQAFEAPLLLELGVGSKLLVSDLNGRLQEWLNSSFNAAPARLSTSITESRYVSSQKGFSQRQVPPGLVVPQVVVREVLPIGKGCVRWSKQLWGPEKAMGFGALVEVLVSGGKALAIVGERGEQIALAPYVGRSGFEFAAQEGVQGAWEQALVALGVDERHLREELGEERVAAMRLKATGNAADISRLIRGEL